MPNPQLVEVTRGPLVECVHTGAVALCRPNGQMVAALGDIRRPVYPRSAVKSFQTLAMLETGAADRFAFGDAEIALSCASHNGSEAHTRVAAGMLAKAGQDESALGCGAHVPMGDAAMAAFHRSGAVMTQLHNNCSGKHAGMVAACVHCGEPVDGYWRPEHPHQRRIHRILAEFTGEPLAEDVRGTDGCSAPNWAASLAGLAHAFAQLGSGEGAAMSRRATTERILAACWKAPEMVAGPGRLDTEMMTALAGEVFVKTGAEGVYCGALPRLGLGFALKIDDGATRASQAVTSHLIGRLARGGERFAAPTVLRNWRGTEVGAIRPAAELLRMLDALATST